MMKVAFYDTKAYDRPSFEQYGIPYDRPMIKALD